MRRHGLLPATRVYLTTAETAAAAAITAGAGSASAKPGAGSTTSAATTNNVCAGNERLGSSSCSVLDDCGPLSGARVRLINSRVLYIGRFFCSQSHALSVPAPALDPALAMAIWDAFGRATHRAQVL